MKGPGTVERPTMTQAATSLETYLAECQHAASSRAGAEPAWLARARQHALGHFGSLGFPSTHDEEWRFTSIRPIADTRFTLATNGWSTMRPSDLDLFTLRDVAIAELVFVNGRYAAGLSTLGGGLPRGVHVESLAGRLAADPSRTEAYLTNVAFFERHAFTALNTAMFVDGAFVDVPPKTVVEPLIHLLFVSTAEGSPTMAHPRVLVVVGESSQAAIVESYVEPGG